MTTVEAVEMVETVDCLNCDGQGIIAKRHFGRHVVEEYSESPCTYCTGHGVVVADWISTCEGCNARYWTGDGCLHGNALCEECRPDCRDCRQDQADDGRDTAYADMMGGRS